MGLFTPKISQHQLQFVQVTLNQLQDSVKLVNTTIRPEIFFKRLHFSLDLLLRLQPYERYKIFKGKTPTQDYQTILSNLEQIVDDFIDRAISAHQQKINSLKTQKAKEKNRDNFVSSMIAAFDCAHTFWEGNRGFPHYTGPLFTPKNYKRVNRIYNDLDKE